MVTADGTRCMTGATFSDCMTYRYFLWRRWSPDLNAGAMLWIMLNPSTADEHANDPTVERCMRRAMDMGFGAVWVANVFALRSTDPKALKLAADPIGPENDVYIVRKAQEAKLTVCGWGNHGAYLDRGKTVRHDLWEGGVIWTALKISGAGEPVHPLYQPYSLKPSPLGRAGE